MDAVGGEKAKLLTSSMQMKVKKNAARSNRIIIAYQSRAKLKI
jgi:hypothetical protein